MSQDKLSAFLTGSPYLNFLGLGFEVVEDGVLASLPFSPHLVGNVQLPALHGGVLAAFMEATAKAGLLALADVNTPPVASNVTIDYLRSGRPVLTYARARLVKVGRRVSNVHVEAWQEDVTRPVAALRGHFLMS